MDWNLAIERNTTALKRVAAMLCAMAGLDGLSSPLAGEDGSARQGKASPSAEPGKGCVCPPLVLPRHLHRAILRLLRPAESAVRRLIIVLARGLVVTLAPPRGKPAATASQDGLVIPRPEHAAASPSPLRGGVRGGGTLPLLDPLKRSFRPLRPAATAIPRISLPGVTQPFPLAPRIPPAPDDLLDATRLAHRLQAVVTALDNLPAQARRFARWRAFRTQERDSAAPARKNRRAWPLRPGRPPGQRPKRLRGHAVHDILSDLHGLAFDALERPDTS